LVNAGDPASPRDHVWGARFRRRILDGRWRRLVGRRFRRFVAVLVVAKPPVVMHRSCNLHFSQTLTAPQSIKGCAKRA
jgi:hypothetical protein